MHQLKCPSSAALPSGCNFHFFLNKVSLSGFLSCLHFLIFHHFSLTPCHLPAAPSAQSALVPVNSVYLSPRLLAVPLLPLSPFLSRWSVCPCQLSHVPKTPPLAVIAFPNCGSQPLFLISLLSFLAWMVSLPLSPNSGFLQESGVGTCHWVHTVFGTFVTAIGTLYYCGVWKYGICSSRI